MFDSTAFLTTIFMLSLHYDDPAGVVALVVALQLMTTGALSEIVVGGPVIF
jgi:hypothetical protein